MRVIWTATVAVLALLASPGFATEALRLNAPVPGCPVCELWLQYEDKVLLAEQEVGTLEDGILYFYHSDDPAVIEPLIRFAHQRRALAQAVRRHPDIRNELGKTCQHARLVALPIRLEISTSARGIFAILRSTDPHSVGYLKEQAKRAVRSKYPLWF